MTYSRMLVLQVRKRGCRFGEKCSYAHRQVDEQPGKRSKKTGDKSAVGYVGNYTTMELRISDMEPPKSTTILPEDLKHT